MRSRLFLIMTIITFPWVYWRLIRLTRLPGGIRASQALLAGACPTQGAMQWRTVGQHHENAATRRPTLVVAFSKKHLAPPGRRQENDGKLGCTPILGCVPKC